MIVEIKKYWHIDLVFHVLSHLNISPNPSNLYSQEYILIINKEKESCKVNTDLELRLSRIKSFYLKGFNKLSIINFIPFFTGSYDELKIALMSWNGFDNSDLQNFILPFIEILEEERQFYYGHWNKQLEKNRQDIKLLEEYLSKHFSVLDNMFRYFNKKAQIYALFSITQKGRGFYVEDYFSAAISFPKDGTKFINSFFIALHEFTHQITDRLVNENISMDNDTHKLSEFMVLVADYLILEGLYPSILDRYLEWICEISGRSNEKLTKEEFLKIFNIPQHLRSGLDDLVCKIK